MEKHIASKSETIGIEEKRNLLEITRALVHGLTEEEFIKIMLVYKDCTERILKENGLK